MKLHTASKRPVEVIEKLPRRENQDPTMRQYQAGFEPYFNMMPVLEHDDPFLPVKVDMAGTVMKALAYDIPRTSNLLMDIQPNCKFARHILAVEEPVYPPLEFDEAVATVFMSDMANIREKLSPDAWDRYKGGMVDETQPPLREGAEVLVAHWGKNFTSPVHGHAPGLLHEDILSGKLYVHTYRWTGENAVRPVRSDIYGPGVLVSKYTPPSPYGPRMGLIHNFTAIEPSVSLHFVAEHTRDGRDNKFNVHRFGEWIGLGQHDVEQINSEEGRKLPVGAVCLVRSANVPDYGDHYIVITGPVELKEHGLRPADVAIHAPDGTRVLNCHKPCHMGLILLRLKPDIQAAFHEFHGIKVTGKQVLFPET